MIIYKIHCKFIKNKIDINNISIEDLKKEIESIHDVIKYHDKEKLMYTYTDAQFYSMWALRERIELIKNLKEIINFYENNLQLKFKNDTDFTLHYIQSSILYWNKCIDFLENSFMKTSENVQKIKEIVQRDLDILTAFK